jgi:hypothetical protein
MWLSKDKGSTKADAHQVLYKNHAYVNLSDLGVILCNKAREYGCPDADADEIMKCGFYRYKDGQIE